MKHGSGNGRPTVVSLAPCTVVLMLAANLTMAQPHPAEAPNQLSDLLRARLESAGAPAGIVIGWEMLQARRALPAFYSGRDYRPAWSAQQGPLPRAHRLVNSIRTASQHGLDPNDYHLQSIEELLRGAETSRGTRSALEPAELADLDLLLTDAFLLLGSHLLVGRVDPRTIDPDWFADKTRSADLLELLTAALASNRIGEALSGLAPQQQGYARLKELLRRTRTIAALGGWQDVPDGPKLERGMRGARVRVLRERLVASGDLPSSSQETTEVFDEAVVEAVRSFQNRHGLEPDGVVGAATLAAMNVPVDQRVRQIELNLERWRWLPDDFGERYLVINIPAFELDVFEGRRSVLNMRAIVGRPDRPTPIFSAEMTYLVLNPSWDVPHNIAVSDIIPAVRRDPSYLTERNIKVFEGWGPDAREVEPSTLDWSVLGKENFPYRLRQEPGPMNALGAVKFVFPNPYNVYIHDTPSREIFIRADRACSSGCVRIENPIELADYLLSEDASWSRKRISSLIDRGTEQTIRLPRTIPVHFVYWTSWADSSGKAHFRKDIYGRDRLLDEALVGEAQPTGRGGKASSQS